MIELKFLYQNIMIREGGKMNIYQATILDVERISHLFNSYKVFYRQESNQEEALYYS